MKIAGQEIENKTLVIAASIVFVFIALGALLPKGNMNGALGPSDVTDLELNLPAIGEMPDLKTAMRKSSDLRQRVELLMTYDTMTLFTNYREVNSLVSEIVFLWSGLTLKQLNTMNANQAIEFFLRKAHGLSPDRPIQNNPYLGEKPWSTQFNRMKARLLIMGQGKGIYDGRAYFDDSKRRMVIEAPLSKKFLKEFKKFLDNQKEAKRFRNNFLVFVDKTKGVKNVSSEEMDLLRQL